MKLYAFRDISTDSPNPTWLPVAVDIDAELLNISRSSFPNDFSFHDAVSNVFNALRDAHTRYAKPDCYGNFIWRLDPPVSFSSVMMNNQQVILMNDPTGVFSNRIVSSIDGVPAVKALFDWGVRYGRDSLDLGTRFNQALRAFTARPLATYGIPETPTVSIQFYNSGSPVPFPWVAYSVNNVSNTNDLMNLCVRKSTEIRNGSIPYIDYLDDGRDFVSHDEKLAYHRSALQRHIETLHQEADLTTKTSAEVKSESKPKVESRGESNHQSKVQVDANPVSGQIVYQSVNLVFSIVEPGIGALKIPSFFPSEFGLDTIYSIKSIPEFLFDMQRVHVLAYELDVEDLIIDLRGNGGGWVCLAMEFLRILFPGPPGTPPAGELFDIISSPLLTQMATAAANLPRDVYSIFSPWKFLHPSTMTPYSTTDWLLPGHSYFRGIRFGTYSNKVTDDCSMVDIPAWNPKYLFTPDHVLVLTDGTCGSACALVARNIQERGQATTMVVGGLLGRPQMVASFIGGLVYDLPTLLEELKLLGLSNSPLAPQPFPTSANLRFTLWEQYPWVPSHGTQYPAEFVFEPADVRLMYTQQSVNNNTALYIDAYKAWKGI